MKKVDTPILMWIERGNAKHGHCLRSEEKAVGVGEHTRCRIVTTNKERPVDLKERSIDYNIFFKRQNWEGNMKASDTSEIFGKWM